MKFLIMISLRNLLRQKRRNILLGSAMAFGVLILVLATSFSHGISDIMFNKIVAYVAGHVNVSIREGKGQMISIFRDRDRLVKIVKEKTGDKLKDYDEGIGIFLRAIGNGKAENMVLVGVNMNKTYSDEQRKEYEESFHMIEGMFRDLLSTDVENPVILSKEKAALLNVKKSDTIRVRFNNIYGQTQSARLTVTGIMSNDNIFMQGVMFVEIKNIKEMMGYRPYESTAIHITLKNPQADAVQIADSIHEALKPGPAFIAADLSANGIRAKATIIPYMGNDDAMKKIISSSFTLISGKMDDVLMKSGVMVSDRIAAKLGLTPGSKMEFRYKPKFEAKIIPHSVEIKGVFRSDMTTGSDTVYMHEALFYPKFYDRVPDLTADVKDAFLPSPEAPFYKALGTEWVLLDRTRDSDEMRKKYRSISKRKIKAAAVDVNSMYESASDVLKLEGALNIITFGAVLVLFFIIVVGVINTLRMTIRERTREIGTIRAIGMQKKDVRTIFILESVFLTLFASAAGTILSFITMWLMSLKTFNVIDNPMGILLVKQHLYFLPTIGGVVKNILLILAISVVTAYFPAKRAAGMRAADALRHYE